MKNQITMPDTAAQYAQSPVFTSATVPKALQSVHSLKAGTWGRLVVSSGTVQYFVPGHDEPQAELSAGEVVIVAPEAKHYVKLSEDAVFQIEFWKAA